MSAASSQIRGLMVLLGILVTVLAIRLAMNSKTVPEFKVGETSASDHLADRIDPNTASVAELAAIPELGEKRAQAIVDFRQRFQSRHPDRIVFIRVADLEQISGIGAATAETMGPYLIFPSAKTAAH